MAYPLKDERGKVWEIALVHQDITIRRQAEEALRQEVREALHRVLQRAITGGVREIPGCSVGVEESLTLRTG